MWRVVIYDITEPNQSAVAVCEMTTRGEYEIFNHQFNTESYKWRDLPDVERETQEAFGIHLPVKPIKNFCLNNRHCEWTGVKY